jgi:hypothetical protein
VMLPAPTADRAPGWNALVGAMVASDRCWTAGNWARYSTRLSTASSHPNRRLSASSQSSTVDASLRLS